MGKEKITARMSGMDMIVTMSEGNPGAINIILQMLSRPDLAPFLLLCDSLGIRGARLYMLLNDCCGNSIHKFKRTLIMFKRGVFTQEEIDRCLSLPYALSFIDDSIDIEGVPSYFEDFDENHPKWKEFCQKNHKVFLEKLARTMSPSTPHM